MLNDQKDGIIRNIEEVSRIVKKNQSKEYENNFLNIFPHRLLPEITNDAKKISFG